MVPWYLLIHSDLWWASDDWWSIFSCWVASWLIQVLTSVTSGKQVPSAETFFLNQMWRIPGLTSSEASECWGTTIFPLCYCLLHFSSWNYLGIYNKIYMTKNLVNKGKIRLWSQRRLWFVMYNYNTEHFRE